MQEMATLLDAPLMPTAAPTRIADFDMPPAPPPTGYERNETTEPVLPAPQPISTSPAVSVPENIASTGFLAETLDIFGGEVIRSEPM